jgi:hypothetical protein
MSETAAQGAKYTLRPRNEIVEILKDFNIEEVVRQVLRGYTHFTGRGVCYLDLTTGEFCNGSFFGSIDDHLLYIIDFSDAEIEEIEERICMVLGIPLNLKYVPNSEILEAEDKIFEALVEVAQTEIDSAGWWRSINEHLDEVYKKERTK